MITTAFPWWQRLADNVFCKMGIKPSSKHRRLSMKTKWHRVALWVVIMFVVVALNVYLGLRNTAQQHSVLDQKPTSQSR